MRVPLEICLLPMARGMEQTIMRKREQIDLLRRVRRDLTG
jgi:hypothetical protein